MLQSNLLSCQLKLFRIVELFNTLCLQIALDLQQYTHSLHWGNTAEELIVINVKSLVLIKSETMSMKLLFLYLIQ